MQNIKLKQAMINIVTMVNGEIIIDVVDNYIRVFEKPHPKKTPTRTSRRRVTRSSTKGGGGGSYGGGKPADNEYVGKISVPMEGGKYYIEFMLRQSDLTDELKKMRQQKITEILGEPHQSQNRSPQQRLRKVINLDISPLSLWTAVSPP